MWVTVGEDVNYQVEYIVNGDFVIPDSATATVRDHGGTPLPGLTNVVLSTASTSAALTIPAGNNTISPGYNFESRYISLEMTVGTRTYYRTLTYKIRPFVPMSTTNDDVRRELGLSASEVPDRDIDLTAAYILLRSAYGQVIDDALVEGTEKNLAVNQAIAVKAALELVTGLEFRAAVKLKSEDSSLDRMSEFDVDAIRTRLGQRLSQLLSVVEDEEIQGTAIFVLSNPTDAITGG